MTQSFWKLTAGYTGSWSSWDRHDIVSIGWDIGDIKKIQQNHQSTDAVKREVKSRLEDKYPDWSQRKINGTAGTILSFTGVRSDRSYKPGDVVVIFRRQRLRGESILYGVGELGQYEYKRWDVEEDNHPYQRKTNYLAKGPVRVNDLSEKFSDLPFRGTENEYKDADLELIDELVSEIREIIDSGGSVDFRERYFNYDALSESHVQQFINDYPSSLDDRLVEIDSEVELDSNNRADFVGTTQLGQTLAIETKVETASKTDIDQLLRYIALMEEQYDGPVHGILIAEDFRDETISYAQKKGIELAKFRMRPNFERVL